jgi:solute carrier family 25 protein 39/40
MLDVATDTARSGRHRFQETSTAGLGQSPAESWPWNPKDTTMATTSGTVTVPTPVTERKDGDISITQRMVSATGGSLLTALLGELHSLHKF